MRGGTPGARKVQWPGPSPPGPRRWMLEQCFRSFGRRRALTNLDRLSAASSSQPHHRACGMKAREGQTNSVAAQEQKNDCLQNSRQQSSNSICSPCYWSEGERWLLNKSKIFCAITQQYALVFPAAEEHLDASCTPGRKSENEMTIVTAGQDPRPEEVPFDEPIEEPPEVPDRYAEPNPSETPARPRDPGPSYCPPEFRRTPHRRRPGVA